MTKDSIELERVPTGVPGLDEILFGGLLKGGVYIVQGAPGAGKTILANQVCFNHGADGGCAVFVTLLAESHTRMLQHIRPMAFFDEAAIPKSLYYISGFDILESDGLNGIVDLLRREIKGRKASLMVLDGFAVTEESARTERDFKKFVHVLTAFPRLESVYAKPRTSTAYLGGRLSTGIAGLDAMLGGGGLPAVTTNGLAGPTGSGKTTIGLQFVAASSAEEPGLFFGFFETPERLYAKGAALNLDLPGLERRGHLEILWRPQGEHILDELGHQIVDAVSRRGVKRLFIDGFSGFSQAAVHSERITRFISVLANQLRALGATTIVSLEVRDVLGGGDWLPSGGMSALLEGLVALRYTELDGRLRRVLSVTKVRDSEIDPFLREYEITSHGVAIGGTFRGVEAVLSGFGREPRQGAAKPSRQQDERED